MGSWYETCAITHVPIFDETEIVMFVLTQTLNTGERESGDAAGACYPNVYWLPRSLPFYGRYADYGRIYGIDHDDWQTKFFLKTLQEDVIDNPTGKRLAKSDWDDESSEHLIVNLSDLTNMDAVQECIHENALFVKRYSFYTEDAFSHPKMGRMFVLRSVFDEMTKSFGDYNPKSLEDVIQDGITYYTAAQNALSEAVNKSNFSFAVQIHVELERLSQRKNLFDLYHNDWSHHLTFSVYVGIANYMEHLHSLAQNGVSLTDAMPVITELSKYLIFNQNMKLLRRAYMPQIGAGSQATDFKTHIRVMQAGIAYCQDHLNTYEE